MKAKVAVLVTLFVIGVMAVFVLTRHEGVNTQRAVVGLDAPSFELKDPEGRTWKLSDFKGKVVLLNFWATWCDSCKEENPSLQKLIDAEKGNEALAFISVLYRDDALKAKEYMKGNGLNFPFLIDDGNTSSVYGLTGVPETFIISKKGIIKNKVVGPIRWDTPEVRAALAKLTSE